MIKEEVVFGAMADVVVVVGVLAGVEGEERVVVVLVGAARMAREEDGTVLDVDAGCGVKAAAPLSAYLSFHLCNSFSASIAKWNKR